MKFVKLILKNSEFNKLKKVKKNIEKERGLRIRWEDFILMQI